MFHPISNLVSESIKQVRNIMYNANYGQIPHPPVTSLLTPLQISMTGQYSDALPRSSTDLTGSLSSVHAPIPYSSKPGGECSLSAHRPGQVRQPLDQQRQNRPRFLTSSTCLNHRQLTSSQPPQKTDYPAAAFAQHSHKM